MKKTIKRISALVSAVACCLVLCSCSAIKQMRQAQAVYSENEGEIIYNGDVYKSLNIKELPDELAVQTGDICYITERDVPVLLSETFGQWAHVNSNKTIINGDVYYAREDVYDYAVDMIENPRLSKCYVEVYNTETLEAEYKEIPQRYLTAIYGISLGYNHYSQPDEYIETVDSVVIYMGDEKEMFTAHVFTIDELINGDIVIYSYDEYYGYDDYLVPNDQKAMIKELFLYDD